MLEILIQPSFSILYQNLEDFEVISCPVNDCSEQHFVILRGRLKPWKALLSLVTRFAWRICICPIEYMASLCKLKPKVISFCGKIRMSRIQGVIDACQSRFAIYEVNINCNFSLSLQLACEDIFSCLTNIQPNLQLDYFAASHHLTELMKTQDD